MVVLGGQVFLVSSNSKVHGRKRARSEEAGVLFLLRLPSLTPLPTHLDHPPQLDTLFVRRVEPRARVGPPVSLSLPLSLSLSLARLSLSPAPQPRGSRWTTSSRWYKRNVVAQPNVLILVSLYPDTNRLYHTRKRARSEEAGVPLDYLQQIHGRHERWLQDRPADFVPAPQVLS
jgi:hypothetical protein